MSELKFAELESQGSVGVGLSLGLGLSIFVLLAMLFLSSLLTYEHDFIGPLVNFVGIIQLAYMVPLYRHVSRTRGKETAKGIFIAATFIFLLNAAFVIYSYAIPTDGVGMD